MKQTIDISILVIFTLLVVFPRAAMSEVKITLRNGRTIIADVCRESEGKITCEKSDGTFRIDKKDILDMKKITLERAPSRQTPEEESVSTEKEADKSAPDLKGPGKQSGEGLVKGLKPEDEARLDQITRKKVEMKSERERLIKERDQFHEDMRNTGMITTQEQFDAIKKRIADLDTRISTFNEDVKKLNEEEQKILESSKSN
jgi:hypothetical protein